MLNPGVRQRGVTLVELMIASVIGLISVAAILTVYVATVKHSHKQLQSAHLHQQMFSLLQLVSLDIRRAGYWQFETHSRYAAENPFSKGENRLRSGALPGESNNSCLLFAYDLDKDGQVGVGHCTNCTAEQDNDNVEQFGFRLNDTSLQMRYAGSGLACDSGYWQTLNEPDTEITHLQFFLVSPCTNLQAPDTDCATEYPSLHQRAVQVELTARQINHPEMSTTLSHWIVVHNDELSAGTP